MRLVDFLKYLLEAHAQTLQRLAALLGEEALVTLLESVGERDGEPEQALPKPQPLWVESSRPTGVSAAYAELESSVRALDLSAPLEFHLWAYAHYRAFIESAIDLDYIVSGDGEASVELVNEAMDRARDWVRALPLPPDLGKRAEKVAEVPWLRFRTDVLRRSGRRPLGPVY